jgi:hypothetical protein
VDSVRNQQSWAAQVSYCAMPDFAESQLLMFMPVSFEIKCRFHFSSIPRSCEAEWILTQLHGSSSQMYGKWPMVAVCRFDEAPLDGGSAPLDWDGE